MTFPRKRQQEKFHWSNLQHFSFKCAPWRPALRTISVGPLVAIPYDFDISGFVNTPYTKPDEGLGIDNVRQRLYQGFCVNNRYVEASISELLQARDALYALVADQQALEPSVRQRLASYMDEFYETIGDTQGVEREILNR